MTAIAIALMDELRIKYFVQRQESPGVLVPECLLLAMAACSCLSALVLCDPEFFFNSAPEMVGFIRDAENGCVQLTGAASMSQEAFFDLENRSRVELGESIRRLRVEMDAFPQVFTAWFCNLPVARANSVERAVQACLNCVTDLLEEIEFPPLEFILNSLGQLLPNVIQRDRIQAIMARMQDRIAPSTPSASSNESAQSGQIVVDCDGEEWEM